jgi:glycosyltransferase involved in cell wall biosynthesis
MAQTELVSVVIPAFNSEATLAATLASVRAQTYANLEIIVIDDGSTDGTLALARSLAGADPRIRVLSKPNGGVSEARNAGIGASRGAFIAPVDADDIWHPEKITRQMAVMQAGGPQMGFVYTGYRRIDADNCAFYASPACLFISGQVFLRHVLFNFVGSGSSLLIRRVAFDAVGGYETDPLVQGNEDNLLEILIARSWTVGVVPEYLLGYRQSPGSVSSHRERMDRHKLRALEHVRMRHPETPDDVLALSEAFIRSGSGVFQLLGRRRPREAGAQFWRSLRRTPAATLGFGRVAFQEHMRGVFRRRGLTKPPQVDRIPFFDLDPADIASGPVAHPILPWLEALEAREEAFFRSHLPVPAALAGPRRWQPAAAAAAERL